MVISYVEYTKNVTMNNNNNNNIYIKKILIIRNERDKVYIGSNRTRFNILIRLQNNVF